MLARLRRRPTLTAWLLLAPGLVYLGLFYIYPTIDMFLVSLQTGSIQTGYEQTWNLAVYPTAIAEYWDVFLRSVGYGAMCLESLVALMALIAACIRYFAA